MPLPLVSCIMPTYNRRLFFSRAVEYFLRQDYPERELIIIDDGTDPVSDLVPADSRIRYLRMEKRGAIGAKRNLACEIANGKIIAHWDDDDWNAPWRLSYQVKNLLQEKADICGLNRLFFYDPVSDQAWQFVYPGGRRQWLAGGTLCYKKSFWQRNPFPSIDVGEDNRFIWGSSPKKILALQDINFYVALVHAGNTSSKRTGDIWWRSFSQEALRDIMGEDWDFYDAKNILTNTNRR